MFIARLAFVISFVLMMGLSPNAASAHDLPFGTNRAAEDAMTIERAARAPLSPMRARDKLFSLVASKLRWKDTVLNVCFWNGDTALRDQVAAIADELTKTLPIKFSWGGDCPGPATPGGPWEHVPVRVSLTKDPSLLASGDDASAFFAMIGREVSFERPATVNLPFSSAPASAFLRNKVLHEFCHVLGCLHEHQRAGCADLFDKLAVMAKYGLTPALYAKNFELLPAGGVYGPSSLGTLDDESVMLYTFKRDMFLAGSSPTCLRDTPAQKASKLDEQGLARLYAATVPTFTLAMLPVLADKSRRYAADKRAVLQGYSQVLSGVPESSPMADGLRQAIAALQLQVTEAQAEVETYDAADEDVRAVKAALALLPRD